MGTTWENTFGNGQIPYLWGIYDCEINDQFANAWLGPYDIFGSTDWSYDTYASSLDSGFLSRDNIWIGQGAWVLTTLPFTENVAAPEPSTLTLIVGVLAGLAILRRKIRTVQIQSFKQL